MPNAPSPSDALTRRRFRPRALPTVATIAAVALFVAAGHWQGRRMEQKEALRAQLDTASVQTPIPMSSLATDADWTALRYRPVAATGEYDARRQMLVDNRVHEGRAGYHVVTPLVLDDGRTVLVNRGWAPQGASRAEPPVAVPPAGTVTVIGRIATPSRGYLRARVGVADRQRLAEPRSGALQRGDGDQGAADADRGDARRPFPTTASCATGRRPISASRSIASTWSSGTRSRRVAIVMWAVVHLRRRAPRADD